MRWARPLSFCALFVAGLSASAEADEPRSVEGLSWRHRVPAGTTLAVRNVNGAITVSAGSGGDAEVRAIVRARTADPRAIRFEVVSDPRGTTVCALWPGMEHCAEQGTRDIGASDDSEVTFEVRVPPGIGVDVVTVNGAVAVTGATAEVNAATVNGDVRVESRAAPVRAESVNGNIAVRLADLGGDGAIRLATVNGDISAELPPRFDAEVSAGTVSGAISILGKDYQDRVRTRIGRGGRKLSAQNVNGSIAIR